MSQEVFAPASFPQQLPASQVPNGTSVIKV